MLFLNPVGAHHDEPHKVIIPLERLEGRRAAMDLRNSQSARVVVHSSRDPQLIESGISSSALLIDHSLITIMTHKAANEEKMIHHSIVKINTLF